MLPESSDSLLTEDKKQSFQDNMVVEFRWEDKLDRGWQWVPIRVRYDKTSELRNGGKNFGNAYHVANSNWQSIHNPITNKIITTGDNVQLQNSHDDVYYNKVNSKSCSPVRTSSKALISTLTNFILPAFNVSKMIGGPNTRLLTGFFCNTEIIILYAGLCPSLKIAN